MSSPPVSMPSPEGHEVLKTAANAPARYVCFGAFQLDLKNAELSKGGARVKLQGKVYQALLALLEKPGELVTREELRLQLWPSDTQVNYDANVNTTVNKLRQVLGDSSGRPAFVETIPRKGYSFLAKVEYVDHPVTPRTQQPKKLLPLAPTNERSESHASLFHAALRSRWFAAGMVSLVIASMMFGAALVLYAHR